MAILLVADTDLVIDYLRGDGEGVIAMRRWLRKKRVRLTAVTAFELRSSRHFERQQADIAKLLRRRTLPLDMRAALRAGAVLRHLRTEGQGIGIPDTLQAGICLRHDLPLATRNVRHFERVPGLRLASLDD